MTESKLTEADWELIRRVRAAHVPVPYGAGRAGLTAFITNERAMAQFLDAARTEGEAKGSAERERLREVLAEWCCPSCGGAKEYRQRGKDYPPEGVLTPCKVCEATGLHPTARQALEASQ